MMKKMRDGKFYSAKEFGRVNGAFARVVAKENQRANTLVDDVEPATVVKALNARQRAQRWFARNNVGVAKTKLRSHDSAISRRTRVNLKDHRK
jgi:hypothetical protein